MSNHKDIEAQLKALVKDTEPTTTERELVKNKTKQQQRDELLLYGAFGFFSVLIMFLAPMWKNRLESKLTNKKRLKHER